MRKIWFLLCVVGLTAGCGPSNVTRLHPAAFIKHFAKVNMPPSSETNATDVAAKPRLITPGMVVTIEVEQDRSLNKQYWCRRVD
jgi:hypothetical protein